MKVILWRLLLLFVSKAKVTSEAALREDARISQGFACEKGQGHVLRFFAALLKKDFKDGLRFGLSSISRNI